MTFVSIHSSVSLLLALILLLCHIFLSLYYLIFNFCLLLWFCHLDCNYFAYVMMLSPGVTHKGGNGTIMMCTLNIMRKKTYNDFI